MRASVRALIAAGAMLGVALCAIASRSGYTIITTPSSKGYDTYVVRVDSDFAIDTEDEYIHGERLEVSTGRFITREVTTSDAGIRCATRLTSVWSKGAYVIDKADVIC